MSARKSDLLGGMVRVSHISGHDALFPKCVSQRAALNGRAGKVDAVNADGAAHVSIDEEGLWAWFHPDELHPFMRETPASFSGRTLLDICLDLRMAHNGSADPIGEDETAATLAYLRQRIAEWKPPVLSSGARFDECVRQLVLATIAEVEAS